MNTFLRFSIVLAFLYIIFPRIEDMKTVYFNPKEVRDKMSDLEDIYTDIMTSVELSELNDEYFEHALYILRKKVKAAAENLSSLITKDKINVFREIHSLKRIFKP